MVRVLASFLRRKCRFPLQRSEATRLGRKHFLHIWMEPTTQGLAPETKHSILLPAVKIIFMCPGAATCCQLLGVNERPGVHHFRQKCCWGRMGHRWPGREMPARTLCSHGPPIRTHWAMGPRAPGCSVCRMQGLASTSPGSSASQERGGRHGGRSETPGEGLRDEKPERTGSQIFPDRSIFSSALFLPSACQPGRLTLTSLWRGVGNEQP